MTVVLLLVYIAACLWVAFVVVTAARFLRYLWRIYRAVRGLPPGEIAEWFRQQRWRAFLPRGAR